MAGDNQAKTDFEQILGKIDRRFDIIHTTWAEQKYFEAKFRTQIPRDSEDFNFLCDEWVELFSQITSTVWVKKISNTGPKIRFRKQYQCWTHGGKTVQKELLFDSRRCKGTLDVKVLTDNPLTRRKNKHIRLGLNVVVKINFAHLHPVVLTKPYGFFVHECQPLPEPPKPVVAPNDKLPQLVAEMVQKGLNSTPKAAKNLNSTTTTTTTTTVSVTTTAATAPAQSCKNVGTTATVECSTSQLQNSLRVLQMQGQQQLQKLPPPPPPPPLLLQQQQQQQQTLPESISMPQTSLQYIHDTSSSVQINQFIPIQNMESIKFELQPSQLAQVVVAAPQLEVTESLFMCQPALMFEQPATEFIPVSTIPPHHFIQVHPAASTQHQGHFLQ